MNSRSDYIKKNLIFNIIKFVAQLVLQFVLRSILIMIMGEEYLGLNGLFTNVLSFLNLAELGIGTAIVFSMYKPIADGNIEKVKSLQALYKKIYTIISIIILSLGIILLPFIKLLIKGDVSVDVNIYILYVMYLANTLVGYMSAHKRSLLFAYQRNDVENKVKTICLLGMTILQIIVLIAFKNYYIFFTVNIVFTIIESVIIHKTCNKLYPEINGTSQKLDETTKKEIFKNVSALSLHKVGAVIVFSTDNILISTLLGLSVLGAYSNYYLIISTITSIFVLFSNALTGSVGNLIASTNKDYTYERFKLINVLFAIFSTFTTVCLIVLFQPFMTLWGSWVNNGISLLSFTTVILMCISYYLNRMRTSVLMFIDGSGLYSKNKFVPILESISNLVISLLLGFFMGLNGIILGTIISTIIAPFWSGPQVLFKHYFKKSVRSYFKTYIRDVFIMLIVCVLCFFICSFIPSGGIWLLIAKFAVCIPLCGGLLLLCYAPIKEFRKCFKWGVELIKKSIYRFKHKANDNK